MNDLENELSKHSRWDIRHQPDRSWWAYREYDKHIGKGDTLIAAVRSANASAAKSERSRKVGDS